MELEKKCDERLNRGIGDQECDREEPEYRRRIKGQVGVCVEVLKLFEGGDCFRID